MTEISLAFGLEFDDLYSIDGLKKIDEEFLKFLSQQNAEFQETLLSSRQHLKIDKKEYSKLIVNIAPYIEEFIISLFSLNTQISALRKDHNNFEEILRCKRFFVQRQAVRKYESHEWLGFDYHKKLGELEAYIGDFSEHNFAVRVNNWLQNKDKYEAQLNIAAEFAAWATLSQEGKELFYSSILFNLPKKRNHLKLVDYQIINSEEIEIISGSEKNFHSRDNFSLIDPPPKLGRAIDQASYCIYCHNQDKDSCSKGLKVQTAESTTYKKNEFDEKLIGCPLEEKISEMNFLKVNGFPIAALVAATIDNPLLAATGNRICNDCMKSCIYQKQDPVNIPQIESRVLHDVLNLDWGFEIYSLLTRWNPLSLERPIPKNKTNKNILVVGLGPAGFNLSHHLLNEGHNICAIDGLKIEPLGKELSGVELNGNRSSFKPIKNINILLEDLDTRTPQGFGGVAEYGITSRWNKNNLKIIRLLLERRDNFRMFGGVRFGSQIDYYQAKELGFDHLALAMGAGRPNLIDIPNVMCNGVRTASDFLMSLQLTGAARKQSFANMQVRLPILVVGGGLTAIDAATESIAYYIRQVQKFSERHYKLVEKFGEKKIKEKWSSYDTEVATEFLSHAELFEQERKKAIKDNRKPNFIKIIRDLGGVNIIYRKNFVDSPSYRLNPEEVGYALKEGIGIIENAVPIEIEIDKNNHLQNLKLTINGQNQTLPVRTMLLAAGTSPNVITSKEDSTNFILDGKYFRAIDADNNKVTPERIAKPTKNYPLLKIDEDGFSVSYFGDLHPSYSGNVVKAMASAKNGYKEISRLVSKRNSQPLNLFNLLNKKLISYIKEVKILAPKIIELIIYSPLAAEKFKPGQFYRLQNYELNALNTKAHEKLVMEGVAVTGAWVDKNKGLVSVIVLEMGGSTDLCRYLQPHEAVVLMGPTGSPTEISKNENVVLIGGGLGNAVLFSIGKAFRDAGNKVIYIAGYRSLNSVYKKESIEEAADQVIWCCDDGIIKSSREQDISIQGNIIDALKYYAQNSNNINYIFNLNLASRVIVIGSDKMMNAVNEARKGSLQKYFPCKYKSFASINSPMQCMMKEICGQCIQKHKDPQIGVETYVYSCFNQDQDMDKVDFIHLENRLLQNSLLEKQTSLCVDWSLKDLNLR